MITTHSEIHMRRGAWLSAIAPVVTLYASLQFSGFVPVTFGPGIKVTVVDIVTLALCLLWLGHVFIGGSVRVTASLSSTMALACAVIMWLAIQCVRSPEPVRGLTLLLIVLRDLAILLLVGTAVARLGGSLDRLNRAVFVLGVAVAAASVAAYVWTLQDPTRVAADPRPGLIYRAGEGLIPHLQGFTHNPIYYAILLLPALFSGVVLPVKGRLRQTLKLGACIFLGVVLVMTFSRGAVLTLGLSIPLLIAVLVFRSRVVQYAWSLAVVLVLLALISSLVTLPGGSIKIADRLVARFEIGRFEMRNDYYWSQLWPGVGEQPLLGHGLRSATIALDGQYTENSYLELLYETGMVGLVLWLLFLSYVVLTGWRASMRVPQLLPWLHAWIVIVIAFSYVSMQFDPLVWVVAGVLVGIAPGSSRQVAG